MQGDELTNRLGMEPLEKATQCRLVGKPGESQQRKEGAIVLQDFGFVDSAQTRHNRIKQCQSQIGWIIVGIALRTLT